MNDGSFQRVNIDVRCLVFLSLTPVITGPKKQNDNKINKKQKPTVAFNRDNANKWTATVEMKRFPILLCVEPVGETWPVSTVGLNLNTERQPGQMLKAL